MLKVIVPKTEFFDENTWEILTVGPVEVSLEHSLISLAKWESKWEKSFLEHVDEQNEAEMVDYLNCMALSKGVPPLVFSAIWETNTLRNQVMSYINAPMTAVKFKDYLNDKSSKSKIRDTLTADLIYYNMIAYGIPFECEKWHLNRLLTLIRVCSIKNSFGKKTMSNAELARRNRELNATRHKAKGRRRR